MSIDYQCSVRHSLKNGEHEITIKVREGKPYRGDLATVIKRAKNIETAAMRALKWYSE